MYRTTAPILIALNMLVAACQSTGGGSGDTGAELRALETQQQAIQRIEREAARDRAGRGP